MRHKTKKSIRHSKKEPLDIKESEKITFYTFLKNISVVSEVDSFPRILQKLYLNKISDNPIKHIGKVLHEDEDYINLKWIVYYLASLGFRFTDIQYLLLETVSNKRLSKWTNELLDEEIFLQAPAQIYLYKESKLKELTDEYEKKAKLKKPDAKKQEVRLKNILSTILAQKMVIINLETEDTLSWEELLILKKIDRRK